MELHSKDRFKKVPITDIAISKVPYICYKGMNDGQNDILYRLARLVLMTAQQENDSNEVALTIDLDDLESGIGTQKGNEHEIVIGADTDSYHLIRAGKKTAIVHNHPSTQTLSMQRKFLIRAGKKTAIVHNHPSTQTLSMQDIHLFMSNDPVRVIVVVSNQGVVHYLMKDSNFDFGTACDLYNSCVSDLTRESSAREKYNAALEFLAHCTEAGLYYH